MLKLIKSLFACHGRPGANRGPVPLLVDITTKKQGLWIPAFAGMTVFLTGVIDPYLSAHEDKPRLYGIVARLFRRGGLYALP